MSNTSKKEWVPKSLEQINEWNKHLEIGLKKEKFKKMAQSAYYFFRGTNYLFWKYFINDERLNEFRNESAETWIQADLHAYNYGIYSNNKGELVYSLNDFDESCIANYQFDLWRMAASIVLIAKENEFIEKEAVLGFIRSFSNTYIKLLDDYVLAGEDKLYEVTKKNAYGKLDEVIEQVEREENRKKMLQQWTNRKQDNLIFDLSYQKLAFISEEKKEEIRKALAGYIKTLETNHSFNENYFDILDIAQRISSGTGSYGTSRYYILIKGNTKEKYGQRILDAKLQHKPAYYHFMDVECRQKYNSYFKNEGQRHKEAYLALNYYSDKHLGWMKLTEGVFSVRERSPYKSYFPAKILNTETRFNKLAEQWGNILATAHIKASAEFDVSGVLKLIKKKKEEFSKLIAMVAFEYVEYNNSVYKSFINKLFLNE